MDKGKFGAVCDYTRPPQKIERIPKLQWDNKRVGWFCMDPKGLGDYQTFVEQACQQDRHCIDGVRRIMELEKQ